MNRASNVEFIVWLIVAVVVMVAKGLGKLATPPETAAAPAASPPHRPPPPKPAVRRPTRRPAGETVPPVIQAAPQPVAEEKAAPQPAAAVPPAKPTRSAQWAAALRDRQNVRNVMIANEIIGRPVSLRDL